MDRRTTAPALQIPVLAATLALSAYFLASFWVTFHREEPRWAEFGRWEMFTWTEKSSWVVEGEALVDGKWEPFDPEGLFPFQFSSGPRYARSAFRKNKKRMATLAASSCKRHPEHPEAVRFTDVTWRRRLGRSERPGEEKLKREVLVEWRCEKSLKLPDGRVL